jgi:hypothetical protein
MVDGINVNVEGAKITRAINADWDKSQATSTLKMIEVLGFWNGAFICYGSGFRAPMAVTLVAPREEGREADHL